MQNHELNLWHAHHQIFLVRFFLHSHHSAHDLHYHFSHRLSICAAYAFVISSARFWALMLSSFIDVSLCSVDAAHMHRRGFDDQMWILLWPRLMLLAYASHRARSFSNPTPDLGCAGHMPILKSNPTPRIFSDSGSTFPTPRPAVTRIKPELRHAPENARSEAIRLRTEYALLLMDSQWPQIPISMNCFH